jgi:hypothetical protein
MTDMLIYWRNYKKDQRDRAPEGHMPFWHSSSKRIAQLQPGDLLWVVVAGQSIQIMPPKAAFLVGIWQVADVIDNPGDHEAFSPIRFKYRILIDAEGSRTLTSPPNVDHILRPPGKAATIAIGQFLQQPRKISEEILQQLKAAADNRSNAQEST